MSKRLEENQRLLDLQTADRVAAAAASARSQLHSIARDVKSSTRITPSNATQLLQQKGNTIATQGKQNVNAGTNATRSKFSVHKRRRKQSFDFISSTLAFGCMSFVEGDSTSHEFMHGVLACSFSRLSKRCPHRWRHGLRAQAWSECEGH